MRKHISCVREIAAGLSGHAAARAASSWERGWGSLLHVVNHNMLWNN
jgi:hypothetical protein